MSSFARSQTKGASDFTLHFDLPRVDLDAWMRRRSSRSSSLIQCVALLQVLSYSEYCSVISVIVAPEKGKEAN